MLHSPVWQCKQAMLFYPHPHLGMHLDRRLNMGNAQIKEITVKQMHWLL
jgi:hypothetical protein